MAQFDWLKIKTEYMTSRTMTAEELAKKYGGDVKYFQNKVSEEKWKDERDEIWNKAGIKIMEKLPETIAQVKSRHVQVARIMQSKMIEKIKNDKITSKSTFSDLKTAIDIERDALGLNDKKADENIQQIQQFAFLINLKPDELRRFIKTVESRTAITGSSDSQNVIDETTQTA